MIYDLDGSLTGNAGYTVLPHADFYPPNCTDGGATFSGNGVRGDVCDDQVSFSRIAFNKPKPDSLLYNPVIVTTVHGNDSLIWRKKDITHKAGWNGLFPQQTVLQLEWQNHTEMTNITYELSTWQLDDVDKYVLIKHDFNQEPDGVGILPGQSAMFINQSLASVPDETAFNGEFYWENGTYSLTYILSGNEQSSK